MEELRHTGDGVLVTVTVTFVGVAPPVPVTFFTVVLPVLVSYILEKFDEMI